MRSSLLALLVACAPPWTGGKCEPVSASWGAPVYHCEGGSVAPVATPDAGVESGSDTPTKIEVAAASKVTLTGDDIVLAEDLEFGGDGTVADGSTPVLDDLGALMSDHPEITKIEITVHDKTKKGAEKRAAMIKKYLIEHKTGMERIAAKGDKGKPGVVVKVLKRTKKPKG